MKNKKSKTLTLSSEVLINLKNYAEKKYLGNQSMTANILLKKVLKDIDEWEYGE